MKAKNVIRLILALESLLLTAQALIPSTSNQYTLPHINGPVTLDGMADEAAWSGIEPLPTVQHSPHFGNKPSEHTEILVAYDDNFLYIAGRLYDKDPEKILATSKRRDSGSLSNDWFGIVIDTFNDKENALGFFTTPAGLRWDGITSNDAQGDSPISTSWNTFWEVKTTQNDKGWFAEMKIPLSSLRFQTTGGHVVMGIITWRFIAHKNEFVVFPSIPPNWGFISLWKPSQAREVVLEGVHNHKPLYIAPYVLGGLGQSFELNTIKTAYHRLDDQAYEGGLDIKYGLTSNLTLDVTLNTDFAQVESDDEQINMTRFSLFFPENRLFFQERSSNFDFNFGGSNRLFYSRRIGIYEGQPVRIYGGARLVGRVGPWDLGLLNMQTAPLEDPPSENFGVLRMRRQIINPYSYIGGILTTRIGANGTYNVAYGLDGIFRLFGNDYLGLKWAQTFETGQKHGALSLLPARIHLNWERRTRKGLGYNLITSYTGADYNPGIGFQARGNYTCLYNVWQYGWLPSEKSLLLRHEASLEGLLVYCNTGGELESAHLSSGWEFESKSGYVGNITPKLFYENVFEAFSLSDEADVPAGKYNFFGLEGTFETPAQKVFSLVSSLNAGSFYDGRRLTLEVSPIWHISSTWELQGTYQINRVVFPDRNQRFTGQIARLRALFMLNTQLSATAFIQYNGVIDAVIANIRFRYNPREGIDFYLVYNEGLNTRRRREFPSLPFTSDRTLMLKYTYTFNI